MKTYQIKIDKSDYKGAPNNAPDLPCPVGIDLHPDIFDAVELRQATKAKDAKVSRRFFKIEVSEIVTWATKNLDPQKNLIIVEATSNSFDVESKLAKAGFSCIIVDSTQTEKVAEAFIDNDQMAAERIARCYLTGFAKVVWVPDEKTKERRELLHAYQNAVADHVRSNNELKSFLTTRNIRPGRLNLNLEKNQDWIRQQLGDISSVEKAIIERNIDNLNHNKAARDQYYRLICTEMLQSKQMLDCLRVVGIGMINAFAILAIVGDVKRFATANKLVSYLGLNPGRKKSGMGKDIKKRTGNRGRKDMRSLLVQAANVVLFQSAKRPSKLGKWGFKLFARSGNRNIAVVAIARKLARALYYILSGKEINLAEQEQPLRRKFYQLSAEIGKDGRIELGLPAKTCDFADYLFDLIGWDFTETERRIQ